MKWSIESNPQTTDLNILAEGVNSYGRKISLSDVSPIACFVRLDEQVVAGVSGRIEFKRLFINYLWVHEKYRKQGIATRLLSELENVAVKNDCQDVVIETLLDEVAEMYLRLGYETIATLPKYVGKFTRRILKKDLK